MSFLNMNKAVKLYARTTTALNSFFDRWTAPSCQSCFKVCKESYPDDAFADMELVEGVFPGCCQAGVAEDFRIMDRGEPLPTPFVTAIRKERNAFLEKNMGLDAADRASPKFTLLDKATGELKKGVGCKWLGEGGCMMTQWKSPICLTFICEPIRQWLSVSADDEEWPMEKDFCGVSGVLAAVGSASTGKRQHYDLAYAEVEALEARLERHSARLEEVSGVIQ